MNFMNRRFHLSPVYLSWEVSKSFCVGNCKKVYLYQFSSRFVIFSRSAYFRFQYILVILSSLCLCLGQNLGFFRFVYYTMHPFNTFNTQSLLLLFLVFLINSLCTSFFCPLFQFRQQLISNPFMTVATKPY